MKQSPYHDKIKETLVDLGRQDVEVYIVEAWMRLAQGTLDHLSPKAFRKEVRISLECIDTSTKEQNENLATSFGFLP